MKRKLLFNTFCFLLDHTLSQYNQPAYNAPQYQYPYQNIQNIQYQYSNQYQNKWTERNYDEYDYEENCSCDNCENIKPSCRSKCPNCVPSPPLAPIGPSYIFFPFPYPYPTAPTTPTTPTTTKASTTTPKVSTTEVITTTVQVTVTERTTTTEKTTKATTPHIIATDNAIKEKVDTQTISRHNPYMMTSLRRMKPNWMPKYGIVPISDQFAEKLMLQMRSMKVLHPRRYNLRNVDEIVR